MDKGSEKANGAREREALSAAMREDEAAMESARRALRQYRVMLTERRRLEKRLKRLAYATGPRELRAPAMTGGGKPVPFAGGAEQDVARVWQLKARDQKLLEDMTRIDGIWDGMATDGDAAEARLLRQYYGTLDAMAGIIEHSGYSERQFYRHLQRAVRVFAQWWQDGGYV